MFRTLPPSFAVIALSLFAALPLANGEVPAQPRDESGPSQAASGGRLKVVILGVRNASGNLRLALYNQADGFRKEDKAFRLEQTPAQTGELSVVFDDLPAGRYALMAYHDANADQRLNLRLGMFPIEGYGLSNNPKVFGPPKFDDSAFEVAGGGETEIKVEIRY